MTAVRDKLSNPPMVGGYRLDEKIGTGAMGTVYRAHDVKLGRDVALKVVNTEDADAEVRQRFLQEGVAAARVRHPNVVQVLDAGKDGPVAYLAMQLLEGETLGECLRRQGRLPVPYAVDLILPVCAALQMAHGAGVLHRDLKPANIFLADVGRGDPEPMLLDFGISKIDGALDTALTQNPRFLGTPLYIAPEQADGAPGSALTDQYSLALTLYECLLGVRPFAKYKESLIQLLRHVAEGNITPPRDLDPSLPEELSCAVCRGLSTDPQARFSSMRDFGAALLPFASEARRALWQLTFVDAERTMTSANRPVTDAQTAHQMNLALDRTRPVSRAAESAEASSVSRRGLSDWSAAQHKPAHLGLPPRLPSEFDPHSRRPSERPLSEPWSRPPESPHPSRGPQLPLSQRLNRLSSRPPPRPEQQSKLIVALSVLIAVVALIGTVALLRHEFTAATHSGYAVRVEVQPPEATLELDGQEVGTGRLTAHFPRDGALHRLIIQSPGYATQTLLFRDEAPPPRVMLVPTSPAADDHAGSHAPAQLAAGALQDAPLAAEVRDRSDGVLRATTPERAARRGEIAIPLSPTGAAGIGPGVVSSDAASSTEPSSSTDAGEAPEKEGTAPRKEPLSSASALPEERSIHTGNLDPWAR